MSFLEKIRAGKTEAPVEAPRGPRFAAPNVKPEAWQVERRPLHAILGRSRPPVSHTAELDRILAIPRRPVLDLESPEAKAFAAEVTARFAKVRTTPCECATKFGLPCFKTLNAIQAWTLHEAGEVGGCVGYIPVGWGKTALDILMPMAIPGVKRAVLHVPPKLVGQLHMEYRRIEQHFHVPYLIMPDGTGSIGPRYPVLEVLPYSILSREQSTVTLKGIRPDLIIGDEGHRLASPDSAGAGRFYRYMTSAPETKFCTWSGTITKKSITDYAPLCCIALGENSPVPIDPQIAEEWGLALDAIEWKAPGGALFALCRPGEALESGFQRRLRETKGFVGTTSASVSASLVLHERKPPPMPATLKEMLAQLRGEWTRPDGEELVDILQVAKSARELACGFFYKWTFPRGEDPELIAQWFERRAAWHKELREKLKRRTDHLDSPLLCAKAAIRHYAGYDALYEGPEEQRLPTWAAETWPAWTEIRAQVQPEPVAEWVDDYLAVDAAAWAHGHKGIVWCEHDAFGRRAAKHAGLPYYGGRQSDPDIYARDAAGNVTGILEDGKRSMVVSMKKYHEGTDGLQRLYTDQLIVNVPSLAKTLEQLLGRLHRIGQEADEVTAWVYRHTEELASSIDTAVFQAKYIAGTLGVNQKLLGADVSWEK